MIWEAKTREVNLRNVNEHTYTSDAHLETSLQDASLNGKAVFESMILDDGNSSGGHQPDLLAFGCLGCAVVRFGHDLDW